MKILILFKFQYLKFKSCFFDAKTKNFVDYLFWVAQSTDDIERKKECLRSASEALK